MEGKRDTDIAKSMTSGSGLSRLIGEVWASIGAGHATPPVHVPRDAQAKTVLGAIRPGRSVSVSLLPLHPP